MVNACKLLLWRHRNVPLAAIGEALAPSTPARSATSVSGALGFLLPNDFHWFTLLLVAFQKNTDVRPYFGWWSLIAHVFSLKPPIRLLWTHRRDQVSNRVCVFGWCLYHAGSSRYIAGWTLMMLYNRGNLSNITKVVGMFWLFAPWILGFWIMQHTLFRQWWSHPPKHFRTFSENPMRSTARGDIFSHLAKDGVNV